MKDSNKPRKRNDRRKTNKPRGTVPWDEPYERRKNWIYYQNGVAIKEL